MANDSKKLNVGDQIMYNDRNARIMAIAEGWAMARRKGAVPFCVPIKELLLGKDWIAVEKIKAGAAVPTTLT